MLVAEGRLEVWKIGRFKELWTMATGTPPTPEEIDGNGMLGNRIIDTVERESGDALRKLVDRAIEEGIAAGRFSRRA